PIVTDARIFLLHVFGTRGVLNVGKNVSVGLSVKGSETSKEEKEEIHALLDEIVDKAWREI
ncbi:unnamed protein product, partial [marine sediment metagenome]